MLSSFECGSEYSKPVTLEAVERYRVLDFDPCPATYKQTLGIRVEGGALSYAVIVTVN